MYYFSYHHMWSATAFFLLYDFNICLCTLLFDESETFGMFMSVSHAVQFILGTFQIGKQVNAFHGFEEVWLRAVQTGAETVVEAVPIQTVEFGASNSSLALPFGRVN